MIELNRTDLGYLLFLVRNGHYAGVQELLGNPFSMEGRVWAGGGPHESMAALRELRNSDDPEFRRYLDLHLITHSLLYRDDTSERLATWLRQEVDFDLHFPGMSWEPMREARWTAVPVLVVHDKARVVYFITGLFSGTGERRLWPDWADRIMDEECRSAVEYAASGVTSAVPLTEDGSFFCFPLIVPGEATRIRGNSMGLSLALGFLSLAKNKPLPRDLVASGALAGTCGSIGEAASLEKKASCAERKGFRVFLYPSCANPPVESHGLELLPVSDLADAWMFTQLYAPGKSRELTLFSEMLRDSDVFLNNVDMVEPAWLEWAMRERMSDGAPGHLLKAPNGPARLVDKIGWALRNWKLDRATAMAGLVSSTGFQSMATSSALSALRFCTQNMALANHRGDVEAASCWYEKGGQVFKKALKADINACADFLNNRFVARHNRYDFSPVFPEQLTSILRCLEDRYAAQCRGGCTADRVLGELYGSICQNFGFCGPGYLSECEAYAQKAVQAFGGGDVPELRDDVLRQECYLAYARLDLGDGEKARAAMFRFLEVGGWAEVWGRMNARGFSRWQRALLARYLADAGDASQWREYLDRVLGDRSNLADHDHPSQLWLYNLGRIALELDRRQEATDLFEESLGICLKGELGPTVHVMALLPLSGLWKLGRLSGVDLDQAKRQISESAEKLNPEYFSLLREKEFEAVLVEVWESPGRLFPFMYR